MKRLQKRAALGYRLRTLLAGLLVITTAVFADEISFEDAVEDGKVEYVRRFLTGQSFAAVSDKGYFILSFERHRRLKSYILQNSNSKVAFVEEPGAWNLFKDAESEEVLLWLKPGVRTSNKALRKPRAFFIRKITENEDTGQLFGFCLSPDDDEDNCAETQHYRLYDAKYGKLLGKLD